MEALKAGSLLISDPFLKDPNFIRTVILLCEQNAAGSFGFVINKSAQVVLEDIVDKAKGIAFPVFEGGPVQQDTLHFLHRLPHLIPGGIPVMEGVYWGGDFEMLLSLLAKDQIPKSSLKILIGYSGWDANQLAEECEEKSWICTQAHAQLIFDTPPETIWRKALQPLGGEYAQMVDYPIDPQLN